MSADIPLQEIDDRFCAAIKDLEALAASERIDRSVFENGYYAALRAAQAAHARLIAYRDAIGRNAAQLLN